MTQSTLAIRLWTGKGGKDVSTGQWQRPYLARLTAAGREWLGGRGSKASNTRLVFDADVASGDVLEWRECGAKGAAGRHTRWVVVTDAGLVEISRALAHDMSRAAVGSVRTTFAIDDGHTAESPSGEVLSTTCEFGGDCFGFLLGDGRLVPAHGFPHDATDPSERLIMSHPSPRVGDLRMFGGEEL